MSEEGKLLGGGVYLKYRYRISFFPVCSYFLLLPKHEKESKWPALSAQAGESGAVLALDGLSQDRKTCWWYRAGKLDPSWNWDPVIVVRMAECV